MPARRRSAAIRLPLLRPRRELARKIAAAVAETRKRFAAGVKTLICVPPFLSRNFTYEYHSLQTGYATLLQESLEQFPA